MSSPKCNYCVYWDSVLATGESGYKECRTKKDADKYISLMKKLGYSVRLHRSAIPKF